MAQKYRGTFVGVCAINSSHEPILDTTDFSHLSTAVMVDTFYLKEQTEHAVLSKDISTYTFRVLKIFHVGQLC